MNIRTISAFAIVVMLAIYSNLSLAKEGALFQDKKPLELILEADVLAIINDKSEDPEYTPAMLIEQLDDNQAKFYELQVKPRGNTRRVTELCDFPPLKFNFKKNQLINTTFEGQDKLKFVSKCREEEGYQSYVLQEYLIYQAYGLLTEESYGTRLVNITIKDNKLRVPPISMTGFFIEDDETLAKRLNLKKYEPMVYNQDSCEQASLDRLAMFQYMIGNTDWYINTKHNTDIFESRDDQALIPVPFDFDFSGVINTEYAKPSKEIPITQVRQRYFKGSCRSDDAYDQTIALFNDKMEEIYNLYYSFDLLPKSVIKKSLKYYTKFYEIINDEKLADASFYQACVSNYPKLSVSK